jgi:hypothetical protein
MIREIRGEIKMETFMMIITALAFFFLIYVVYKDGYEHPVCPKCGHDLYCKRNESGKIICDIHEDVTDENIITRI